MIPWKDRLYAFLLSRVLGPWLDDESLELLHQSIEVSLQEGKLVLKRIGLNTKHLSEKLSESNKLLENWRISRASLERLDVSLSLEEVGDDTDGDQTSATTRVASEKEEGGTLTFAWRAWNLGSTAPSGGQIALIAKIVLHGLVVHVEPDISSKGNDDRDKEGNDVKAAEASAIEKPDGGQTSSTSLSSTAKTLLSSYLDAALGSLRLSVHIHQLAIRLIPKPSIDVSRNEGDATTQQPWLELRVKSISYHDVEEPSLPATKTDKVTQFSTSTSSYNTVMHKSLDLERISVLVGKEKDSATLLLLDGATQLRMRVIQYNNNNNNNSIDHKGPSSETTPRLQQDFEVFLGEKLSLFVDAKVLRRFNGVIRESKRSLQPAPKLEGERSASGSGVYHSAVLYQSTSEPKEAEELGDLKAIQGIMKQYNDARAQAERYEVRGGLLLPDTTNDGDVVFDAFFDANDKSFYHYSAMLSKSQAFTQASNDKGSQDFVHTKLRFHLNSVSAKLAFPSPVNRGYQRSDDYVLATISDVQASWSKSQSSSTLSLSLSHFEIDEARGGNHGLHRGQIGTILAFPSMGGTDSKMNRQASDDGILLDAPCLSLNVETSSQRTEGRGMAKSSTLCEIDVDIEPFVLLCPPSVLRNISALLSEAFSRDEEPPLPTPSNAATHKKESDTKVSLRASCAHFDIALPLDEIPVETWSRLFRRNSVLVADNFVIHQSALGVHVERFSTQIGDHNREGSTFTVCFQHMLGYAYLHSTIDREHRLVDMIALAGDLDPAHLKVGQNADEDKRENQAAHSFPFAPAVSSFKARQEDDDEDGSPIFSPSEEFNIASRQELRGPDPQPQMLSAVSRAQKCVDISIPRMTTDLSLSELRILMSVLESQAFKRPHEQAPKRETVPPQSQEKTSLTVAVNEFSLAVHADTDSGVLSEEDKTPVSYLLRLNQCRSNVLLQDNGLLHHVRILAHDAGLSEVVDYGMPISSSVTNTTARLTAEDRAEAVRRRLLITSRTRFTPICHRSHLFTPISRQSPAILIDILDAAGRGDFTQKSVYLTLYDLTHRFDYDSKWTNKVQRIVKNILDSVPKRHVSEQSQSDPQRRNEEASMTRLFLCLADCNIDYLSPCRWNTGARMILRLGEVRVSCNLMQPAPVMQAIKLSVNDVSLMLCNSRFSRGFEDSKLVAVEAVVDLEEVSLVNRKSDDVLRDMNSRTVLMLDSLDAVLTVCHSDSRKSSQPRVHVGLTVGELNLFACKDSFALFSRAVGELCAEACAMDDEKFLELKRTSVEKDETYYDSMPHEAEIQGSDTSLAGIKVLENLKKRSALRPSAGTSNSNNGETTTFLLDGYDWTAIDQDECAASGIPRGDEQAARWYKSDKSPQNGLSKSSSFRTGDDEPEPPKQAPPLPFCIINHHFPLVPSSDPLADGDMGAAKYAGTENSCPQVKTRVTVTDLSLKLRLFDGYDWPESLADDLRSASRKGSFVIDLETSALEDKDNAANADERQHSDRDRNSDRKATLIAGLLDGPKDVSKTFQNLPLPEERGARLKVQAQFRRLARRSDKYVQISASGVQLRNDSMEDSDQHRLVSCLNLKAYDFFLAETISANKPVKMVGEWWNDTDHPRDSKEGLFMMKMITWNAATRVSPEGELVNDECEAAVKMLPLRCFLDQKAIRFMKAFFSSDAAEEKEATSLPDGLHSIPPPLFRKFVSKPLKLKVNYRPEKLDQSALRNGQIVELLNISPLEGLVLTLDQVEIESVVGFGGVISALVPRWIQYITSTQMLKFITNAKPFEPITTVGGGFSDMVVLPWDAIKNGGDFQTALRAGASSFGRAVAHETLTLSSEVAEVFAAAGSGRRMLPPRPIEVPTGMQDTASHVVESLSRGLQAANTTIVVIPYREYQRNGTTGLVSSVIRGIPVAITAPTRGAAEAISYSLIGLRNRLRPDIRREEEVAQRGLRFSG